MADAEVARWMRAAGLSRFLPRFEAAAITKSDFLELLSSDFDALGVDSPADRKRLSDLIAERRRAASLPRRCTPPRAATTAGRDREMPRVRHQPKEDRPERPPEPKRKERARVAVCVRKRPLSRKEVENGDRDIIKTQGDKDLNVFELKEKVDLTKYVETHEFSFDKVFSHEVGNEEVYQGTAKPLVEALFTGGRSTCFAYGQTGAGKTFTMAGDGYRVPGLYALAVHDLFERIAERKEELELQRAERSYYDSDYADAAAASVPYDEDEEEEVLEVWISFFEIYGTRLHDLLGNRAKLECREDANNEVQIVGLVERKCDTEEEVMLSIDEASAARSTGVTGVNDDSSRSHAVFQIELRESTSGGSHQSESSAFREALIAGHGNVQAVRDSANAAKERGRLCFIDLAGSERGSDTARNNKQTRIEGAEINKSLLALKECIRAMGQRKDHTPFRGSKLTQVLKASFIGKNCRTVMIANVSPASSNVEHTLNTLRYSDRVKEIRKDRGSASFTSSQRGLSTSGRALRVRRATLASGVGVAAAYADDTKSAVNLAGLLRDRSSEPVVEEPTVGQMGTRRSSEKQVRAPSIPRPSRGSQRTLRAKNDAPASAELPPAAPDTGLTRLRESRLARRRASQSTANLPQRAALASGLRRGATTLEAAEPPAGSSSGSGSDAPAPPPRRGPRRLKTPPGRDAQTSGIPRPAPRAKRRPSVFDAPALPAATSSASSSTAEAAHERPRAGAWGAAEPPDYFSGADDDDGDLLFADDAPKPRPRAKPERRGASPRLAAPPAPPVRSPVRTRAAARKRLVAAAEPVSTSATTSAESGGGAPPSDCVTDTSKRVSARSESGGRPASPALRDVIRHHHMQIEELMRLCEADVQLVRAAETGDIDAAVYAMKLELNLSQKLDMVISLKAKLGWLLSDQES